ncbi:Cell division protein DedD [Aquicella siphonis]|uniref:Cell division protein DedD n=1 Tax=Aquicella siphonis TaxID=254247 RepID=A0A5E4PFT4_9COXI|nr:SPOR domain-containing protein [Aquicella siphonis]VVC75860.1 Cell division protein DedD [Aquicella siphonis]
MERQTKHRILGILVVIGLVIILLPLFQGGKELSTEAALVKTPPFPDQSIQVTAAAAAPEAAVPVQPAVAEQATAAPQPVENHVNQTPEDVITATHPSVINAAAPGSQTLPAPFQDDNSGKAVEAQNTASGTPIQAPEADPGSDSMKIQLSHSDIIKSEMMANKSKVTAEMATTNPDPVKTSNYRIIEGEKAAVLLKKNARLGKNSHSSKSQNLSAIKLPVNNVLKSAVKTPIDDDGLIKLKSAVWVIQIGSFKNKANALRVVNQLRANGYRAFIQQISTAMGESTRVFVGPENKRTTARDLADRLQSEMHIQGIVISYKPLTL